MNIRIGLTRSDYICLLGKVPADSPLRRVMELKKEDDDVGMMDLEDSGAMPMGDDVEIYCSTEDAGELLKIAGPHCPDAVYPIEKALRGLA